MISILCQYYLLKSYYTRLTQLEGTVFGRVKHGVEEEEDDDEDENTEEKYSILFATNLLFNVFLILSQFKEK